MSDLLFSLFSFDFASKEENEFTIYYRGIILFVCDSALFGALGHNVWDFSRKFPRNFLGSFLGIFSEGATQRIIA
jgi:hypothetical protein